MLYIASDHAGFKLKEKIKSFLTKKGIEFEDVGAFKYNKTDDYPDFAYKAAKKIAENPLNNKGVLICSSGVGVSITANKVRGVYCAQVWKSALSRSVRDHNQVNAIALGAKYISEREAVKAVFEFLKKKKGRTAQRHLRRFNKIKKIERKELTIRR